MSVLSPCFHVPPNTIVPDPMPPTVREAMVTRPKTCNATIRVEDARTFFEDDHVHTLLLVRGRLLVTVVERGDLRNMPRHASAAQFGRLTDRVIAPDAPLDAVFQVMINRPVRRLAVVDGRRNLLGLLCLKRSQLGFCSDEDVLARATSGQLVPRTAC